MALFKYSEEIYVDIFVKYYDKEDEEVVKRKVRLDVALLMVEQMLAIKKLQWALYNSKVMSAHVIEYMRLD